MLCAWGVAIDLSLRDVVPFDAIARFGGVVLAGVLVWAGTTIAWVAFIVPLRWISDAPPLRPAPGDDCRSMWERAKAEVAKRDTPEARRRYHACMAGAAFVVGIVASIAVAANVELAPATLLTTPIVAAGVGIALVPYHLVRALIAR